VEKFGNKGGESLFQQYRMYIAPTVPRWDFIGHRIPETSRSAVYLKDKRVGRRDVGKRGWESVGTHSGGEDVLCHMEKLIGGI